MGISVVLLLFLIEKNYPNQNIRLLELPRQLLKLGLWMNLEARANRLIDVNKGRKEEALKLRCVETVTVL
jgi:hypothetical protein